MSLIINPGTGPVGGDANRETARANMDAFVRDVLFLRDIEGRDAAAISIEDTAAQDGQGRFTFILRHGDRSSEIEMPGIPLERVRYLGGPGQNIWDFPRLYENGSSWVWCFAVEQSRSHLFEGEE